MVTPALISPPRPASASERRPLHTIQFEGDEVLSSGEVLKYLRLAAYYRGPLAGIRKHLTLCKDEHCARPHCRSSRRVIDHFKRCTDPACSVCAPTHRARRQGKLLISLRNAARGRGNDEDTALWQHLQEGCNAGAHCRWPRCAESKGVLAHIQYCTDALCPVCLPIMPISTTDSSTSESR